MKNPVEVLRTQLKPGREYKSRINQEQSPLKMMAIPIGSIMIGSIITTLPFIESQPILPPFGFLMLLAWRLMRPSLLPVWSGLPFGLFDDLFSGQPFGSAGLLWSVVMLLMEAIDSRALWRDHWQDWFLAALMIILVLIGGWWISGLAYARPQAIVLLPQIMLSMLIYPLVVRLCSRLDGWRLST